MPETQMQLEDWLDDLCVRFIINLPQEDLSSVARICFQVEEAQWFYEDFIRPLDPNLPSMSLRTFCLRIFQHCPLLASFSVENHTKAFEEFLEYKTRVPVRGAILLNEAMDSTVLVKGWKKGANWSFPRGKINKDEDDLDCAVREVYEETGLDLQAAGLVPNEGKPKYIEIAMREQHMRLYVFRDVPMDTNFEPRTRKEISKIEWYKLSELPAFRRKGGANNETGVAVPNANKFYMVAPFLVPLKKWVVSQKNNDAKRAANEVYDSSLNNVYKPVHEAHLEDDTWTQTDTGAETSRTPAIETLAGATQELQRLLKVQPATQGLQPIQTQEDKGSALLSLLQAGPGLGPSMGSHRNAQFPHTPLGLTVEEAPQPQTPHHHVNHQAPTIDTQRPPPSFNFPPNQAGSWNIPPIQARQAQPFSQQFPAVHGQNYGDNNQAMLVHPQPLPPQVQRAVFNRSAFQENPQPRHVSAEEALANAQKITGYPGAIQVKPHTGPYQLNGQSMSLLNAFKGGAESSHQKENARQPQTSELANNQPSQAFQHARADPGRGQAPTAGVLMDQGRHVMSPQELAGSKVGPPQGAHRSALLGMFSRKPDSELHTSQTPLQGYADGAGEVAPMLSGPTGPSMPTHTSSLDSVDAALPQSINSMPIQLPTNHSRIPPPQLASQYGTQRPVPAGSQLAHPVRILQRGQGDQSLAISGLPAVSPQTSPQEVAGQPVNLASPPNAAALPILGDVNRRPGSGPDQKRQLLSLFGKQQQASAGLEASKGKEVVAEVPRSRVASLAMGPGEMGIGSSSSSRRGSQTPISPAHQKLLLGYLESVTSNATR
ncbi:hypothetical protein G7046_g8537 [Stylonectria norvegica]|nr:hypothetical protein G7046_g8537 [Stylonectria norvegica]